MDVADGGRGAEEEADGAERAFEALRADVAGLGRRLDQLVRQSGQGSGASAPDYSPTLGAIAKELRAVGSRLDGIEAHPALGLTPAAFAQQVAAGVRQVETEAGRSLTHAQERFSDALQEMRRLIGSARSQFVQQRRERIAVGIGAVLGFLAWYPLVQLAPWDSGDWLASTLVDGGGRWRAGAALMKEADPATWERLTRLYKACPQDTATDLCEVALAVRTIPPIGQPAPAPEGAKAPASGTVPASPHGKAGR